MAVFDPFRVGEETIRAGLEASERHRPTNRTPGDEMKKLYIEPTSKCNLACTMCFRNSWVDEPFSDMEAQVFEKLMNTLPESVEMVFFGGMGEPLAHKDIICMVKRAADKGRRVELLTNGTLLTSEMSAALLDAGLHMLWVSIDSFDATGYESIRQSSNFALIQNNIRLFNTERMSRESETQLGIAFVAMKSNIHQLGRLAQFAYKNRVSNVNITNVIPTNRESEAESLYSNTVDLELYSKDRAGACPEISLPYMDFRMAEVREGFTDIAHANCHIMLGGEALLRKKRYCRFVEEGNAFIRHDGDVSPCMAVLHSGTTYLDGKERTVYHHSFGNVRESALTDIWNSKEYRDFRNRVREFSFSPCIQCGGCDNREDNRQDCLGNPKPTCGACLWSEGIISCP
jgi:MoaA/NifB/PqqE/SkfB family radical SAM enzyme